MKKILFSIALVFAALNVMAQDNLKVNPFKAPVNEANEDWDYDFEIELNNEVADTYTAIEFDLYLPKGMDLLEGDASFEFSFARCPGKIVKGNFAPQHSVQVCENKGDYYKVVIADPKLGVFTGTEGTIINVYYKTTSEFAEGANQIKIMNQVLVPAEGTKVKHAGTVTDITGYTPVENVKADKGAVEAKKIVKNGKVVVVKADGTEVGADAIVK